jgi:hypothetical protein
VIVRLLIATLPEKTKTGPLSPAEPLVVPAGRPHARKSTCAELPDPSGSTSGSPAVPGEFGAARQLSTRAVLVGTVRPTPDRRSVPTSAIDLDGLGICRNVTPQHKPSYWLRADVVEARHSASLIT